MSDKQFAEFSASTGCLGKQRFEAAAEANRTVAHMKRRNNRNSDGSKLRAYSCPRCGGWHVGHKRKEWA